MDQLQKTKNIKLCAYLRMKNIHPIEVKIEGRGRGEYVYKMSDKDWRNHQIEFNQSPFLDYANNLEAIKDMAY